MILNRILAWLATSALVSLPAAAASAAEITVMRFFGNCEDTFGDVTDPVLATGECGVITALVNEFNSTNQIGARVDTRIVDRTAYYDRLAADFTTGDLADIVLMHDWALPNFASRNLLLPLTDVLVEAEIETDDILPAALAAASWEGQILALPYDLQPLVVHVNMELFRQAGLVSGDAPDLPVTADAFLESGREFKEGTGVNFLAIDAQSGEGMLARLFTTLVWQQGGDLLSDDTASATLNGPEGLAAATFLRDIYAEGLADPTLDASGAEQVFVDGGAGILIGSSGKVDAFAAQAAASAAGLQDYSVTTLPPLLGTEVVWAGSHLWVLPADVERTDAEHEALVAFLAFLDERSIDWGRSGNLPVRRSTLDSPAFADLPFRDAYVSAAEAARLLPQVPNLGGIQNALIAGLASLSLSEASPREALARMHVAVDRILRRGSPT